MAVVTIKIEQMKPERKLIEEAGWNDLGRTYAELTEVVEQHIKTRMNTYRRKFPEMTELRWEFADVGQGHYVQITGEPMTVYVNRLSYSQLVELIEAAVANKDWKMVEDCAYQLRLIGDVCLESYKVFEVPYAVYEFDWMYDDDRDEHFVELDEALEPTDEREPIEEPTINDMVPQLEEGDEYYELAEAVREGLVSFESNGQNVTNPFYDETLRDRVDPQGYYGWVNIKQWMGGDK